MFFSSLALFGSGGRVFSDPASSRFAGRLLDYGFPGEAPTLEELLKAFLEAESAALNDAGLVAVLEAVVVAGVVKARLNVQDIVE
ncbi:unnamed protein product [Clonostachys rhizophaga]|uniref:Uncharacterized protein n=1 Tax=Clonostachys rhizophaga TaxID=160324 RepID=A0A9N9V7I6_9HYPO|nr:unnamed protein product [Clonostachys rhizophaga]